MGSLKNKLLRRANYVLNEVDIYTLYDMYPHSRIRELPMFPFELLLLGESLDLHAYTDKIYSLLNHLWLVYGWDAIKELCEGYVSPALFSKVYPNIPIEDVYKITEWTRYEYYDDAHLLGYEDKAKFLNINFEEDRL